MSLSDVVVAVVLCVLVCVLASAGPGWDIGGQTGLAAGRLTAADGNRFHLFCVAAAASSLAVVLAEHGRRTDR